MGSIPTGGTNLSIMNTILQSLKENAESIIKFIEVLDREVRSMGLENEQWFLDWQDELNKISVK